MNIILKDRQQSDYGDQIDQIHSDKASTTKSINRVVAKISKPRSKRRERLQWIPIIMRNILRHDNDPVYIYYFMRMMKRYDNDDYIKYKDFGFIDGAIGCVTSIQLDKQNECIDFQICTYSEGSYDFHNLIRLYKSYQNQKYYDLALVLEDYQAWSYKKRQNLIKSTKSARQHPQGEFFLQQVEQQFGMFETRAKQWANNLYHNEMYELIIGVIDIKELIPNIRKQIFSQNLIYLIGSSLEEIYENASSYKNKDFLPNLVRGGNTNGMIQLEKTIKQIKESINESLEYEFEDELVTIDGFCIPVKKKVQIKFHNFKTGEITVKPHMHFIIITFINIEPHWLKFLIEKRAQFNQYVQSSSSLNDNQNLKHTNQIRDLDYICQQEYFLEKFNYIQHKNNQTVPI